MKNMTKVYAQTKLLSEGLLVLSPIQRAEKNAIENLLLQTVSLKKSGNGCQSLYDVLGGHNNDDRPADSLSHPLSTPIDTINSSTILVMVTGITSLEE